MENEKVCQNSILEDIDFFKMFIKICPNTKLCYLYYSVDQNREPKGQLLQWSLVFHVWSGYWSKIYKLIELGECLRDSGPSCFCGPGVRRKKKVCVREGEGGWVRKKAKVHFVIFLPGFIECSWRCKEGYYGFWPCRWLKEGQLCLGGIRPKIWTIYLILWNSLFSRLFFFSCWTDCFTGGTCGN